MEGKRKSSGLKVIIITLLSLVAIPASIILGPIIILGVLQALSDMGVIGGIILLSPVWIIAYFVLKAIFKTGKKTYNKVSGRDDLGNVLSDQDKRARERANENRRIK